VNDNQSSGNPIADPLMWEGNELWSQDAAAYAVKIGIGTNVIRGALFAHNLLAISKSGASVPYDVMQSGRDNELFTNICSVANTVWGTYHSPFQLAAGANITTGDYLELNNLWGDKETGEDVHSNNGALTNRNELVYCPDASGNVSFDFNNPTLNAASISTPDGNEAGFGGLNWAYYHTNWNGVFINNNSFGSAATNFLKGDFHLVTGGAPTRIRTEHPFQFNGDGGPASDWDSPGMFGGGKGGGIMN
jgi:hypothetical protein